MHVLSPLAPLTALVLLGTAAAQAPDLTNTSWTLTQATVGGVAFPAAPGAAAPTLRLDGRAASGTTGCNVYRGPYALRGEVLRFGPLAASLRACPDQADGQEARFLNLLRKVTGYRLSGNTATLLAGPLDRLIFRAGGAGRPTEATVNLDGTWRLSGGTALRPLPGQAPSLTLAGGRVGGTGGCNRLNGTVQASGRHLTFGPLASTRMLCAPEVNAQEAAFLRFLGRPNLRAQVQGDRLTLTGAAGQTLVFRRDAAAGRPQPGAGTVQDGSYTLATVNGQPAPSTPQPVTLTLRAGQLGGSDGCNTFGAPYQLESGQLVLTGEPVSTLRACPDQPETVNLPALLAARPTLTPTADGLMLQASGTTLIFTRN